MSYRIKLTLEELIARDEAKYPDTRTLNEVEVRLGYDATYTFQQAARILIEAIAEGPQPGEPEEPR